MNSTLKTVAATLLAIFVYGSSVLAQCTSNEVLVTIELSTDNYGYEAYWELLDESNNVLDSGGNPNANPPGQQIAASTDPGAYGNGGSYSIDVCVANPSTPTFKLYDDYADGGTIAKIYVDGVLVFTNESNPLAYKALLTQTFTVPVPNLDLGITKVTPESGIKINLGYKSFVNVTLQNFGKIDATSFKLEWTVDSQNVRTQTFSGFSLAPGYSQEFTADLGWEANEIGNKTLSVKISDVNSVPDGNPNNNELNQTIEVFKRERMALVELWTNAGCNPCAQYVPGLVDIIDSRPSYAYQISHQADWPGYDPMNQHNPTEVTTRGNYYGISSSTTGYPSIAYNGGTGSYFKGNPGSFDEQDADEAIDDPTTAVFENLSLELDTVGTDSIKFSGTLKATGSVPTGCKVYMVVVEEKIHFNTAPGSNGMKDFEFVMKKYVPSVNGINISSMSAGDTRTFSGSWELKNVYNNDELAVVFFVQRHATREVLNAEYINLKSTPDVTIPEDVNVSVHELSENNILKFYPNPAQNEVFLNYSLTETSDVNIKIFDQLGREQKSIGIGSLSGSNTLNIRTEDLSNGLYILQVQLGNEIRSDKFLIQR